jgi:hypothetical protein
VFDDDLLVDENLEEMLCLDEARTVCWVAAYIIITRCFVAIYTCCCVVYLKLFFVRIYLVCVYIYEK